MPNNRLLAPRRVNRQNNLKRGKRVFRRLNDFASYHTTIDFWVKLQLVQVRSLSVNYESKKK
jgi:hypothetical protein